MIKAIIFDMDGVIVNSIPIHFQIWKEVGEHFGFAIDSNLFDEVNGMDTRAIAKYFVEKFSLNINPEKIWVEKRKIAGDRLEGGVELFPNVEETLTHLKKLDYKIGLATSTPRNHQKITLGKYFTLFDKIVTVDDVLNSKPAPDIFMKCAEELRVPYENCVVVEDAINGVKAAKAGGMIAVAITNTTDANKFDLADAVISNIKVLNQKFLDKL
jgi:HAD superfamily hydrolase (TIGR01509 family)